MSTDIERLLYYERQYLQSSDFTDEQTYHLEMRRRLNLALHLWGIVEGLDLLNGTVSPGAPNQFYVSEGMAIDAYGREIIVSAKHLLADDLVTNRIPGPGDYSVWIGYTRQQTTPPQAGFQACNGTNQYTRWQESFQIIIRSSSANPNPSEDPDPFGDLSDDPTKNPWLIHLGTINVRSTGSTLAIAWVKNIHRIYVGLRTQRIVAPRDATAEYNVLSANAPRHPLTSIAVRDNLFLEQNLIAGTDFLVDPANIQPKPSPTPPSTFPNPTGNVKIASDLFLQGNLYTVCDPTQPDVWMNLDQCIQERIKNSIPDIHIGTTLPPLQLPTLTAATASNNASVSADVSVTTQLPQPINPTNILVNTSIANIKWNKNITTFQPGLSIETSAPITAQSGSTYTFTLTCTVGPLINLGASDFEVPIDSVEISYVIIFYPKTS